MMLSIFIHTDNAAFDGGPIEVAEELKRVLANLARGELLEEYAGDVGRGCDVAARLLDSNGVECGSVRLERTR